MESLLDDDAVQARPESLVQPRLPWSYAVALAVVVIDLVGGWLWMTYESPICDSASSSSCEAFGIMVVANLVFQFVLLVLLVLTGVAGRRFAGLHNSFYLVPLAVGSGLWFWFCFSLAKSSVENYG